MILWFIISFTQIIVKYNNLLFNGLLQVLSKLLFKISFTKINVQYKFCQNYCSTQVFP
jgi:hypothetical protein